MRAEAIVLLSKVLTAASIADDYCGPFLIVLIMKEANTPSTEICSIISIVEKNLMIDSGGNAMCRALLKQVYLPSANHRSIDEGINFKL